jgi:hypothetical protein
MRAQNLQKAKKNPQFSKGRWVQSLEPLAFANAADHCANILIPIV